ncbi:hypothetical protein [Heyndrickxia acidicola]|uniref:Uncharacterized protein n=1 Tax=Heyndrickxia acidicola TaxID=209389 RepID=A0ABU6MLM4_9BACI|nr:hypothetical protein [Heyndrickxia acidicola]MED1205297.1 hypothetical protein [Heyndrickxia acidicola]
MYQLESGRKRKTAIHKVYVCLFIVSGLINSILFFINEEAFQGIASLSFLAFILFFVGKQKVWAVFIIKYTVWLNLLILLAIIAVLLFK